MSETVKHCEGCGYDESRDRSGLGTLCSGVPIPPPIPAEAVAFLCKYKRTLGSNSYCGVFRSFRPEMPHNYADAAEWGECPTNWHPLYAAAPPGEDVAGWLRKGAAWWESTSEEPCTQEQAAARLAASDTLNVAAGWWERDHPKPVDSGPSREALMELWEAVKAHRVGYTSSTWANVLMALARCECEVGPDDK